MNVLLRSVPGLVAASALPHVVLPESAPTLPSLLASALRQPAPADLGPTASAAGARVLDATSTYVRSARSTLGRLPRC